MGQFPPFSPDCPQSSLGCCSFLFVRSRPVAADRGKPDGRLAADGRTFRFEFNRGGKRKHEAQRAGGGSSWLPLPNLKLVTRKAAARPSTFVGRLLPPAGRPALLIIRARGRTGNGSRAGDRSVWRGGRQVSGEVRRAAVLVARPSRLPFMHILRHDARTFRSCSLAVPPNPSTSPTFGWFLGGFPFRSNSNCNTAVRATSSAASGVFFRP